MAEPKFQQTLKDCVVAQVLFLSLLLIAWDFADSDCHVEQDRPLADGLLLRNDCTCRQLTLVNVALSGCCKASSIVFGLTQHVEAGENCQLSARRVSKLA